MKHRRFACTALAVVAGCATVPAPDTGIRSSTARSIASGPMVDAVTPGRSTRSDILATFGAATVVRFDSGYEVWVYRFDVEAPTERNAGGRNKEPGAASGEFVLLFDPTGTVAKTRVLEHRAAPR